MSFFILLINALAIKSLSFTSTSVANIISCRQDEFKNKICMRIIEEMCKKYDDAKEFVDKRIKELCVQDTILIREVRIWFKGNLF